MASGEEKNVVAYSEQNGSPLSPPSSPSPSPPPSPLPGSVVELEPVLERLESYRTVLPEAAVEIILSKAGLPPTDPQVTKLIALVAQKFVSDVAYEALQHCKMRGGGKEQKKMSGKDRKFALATEDLAVALADQGMVVKKPPYFI